ncbi:MAG: hypothetical protein QOD42_916 [Sphingomonadales bacterium]|nr:hypothetical protein [Sphingomonadales bacterium]
MTSAAARAASLRAEALDLLAATGIVERVRARFGETEIVGSAAFDLMTWRDMDIYTRLADRREPAFLGLLPALEAGIAAAGHALVRATYNDEYRRPDSPYGAGLYLGLRILTAAGQVWKVDLWGWDAAGYAAKLAEHHALAAALAGADRGLLLDIKAAASAAPGYRRSVTSMDVYRYVLAGGASLAGFRRLRLDAGEGT